MKIKQFIKIPLPVSVSHTTDDLIFEWYPPELIPLVVEPIQLPQLELIHNTTEDCTTSYSTGRIVVKLQVKSLYIVVFR